MGRGAAIGTARPTDRGGARKSRRLGLRALVRLLNDPGRGALLDALHETARCLRSGQPLPDAWALETLDALAGAVLDRLARLGVRPMRSPGETLTLARGQIAGRFEYQGTPFSSGERRKRVVVVSPGWTVRGRAAIRPVVRELRER